MTRKEAERQTHQADMLQGLGFTREEAYALRRISMTLQRWYTLECGDSNTWGSWAIERDDNGDGPPFMVRHHYLLNGPDRVTRTRIADREAGAVRRLQAIIKARNTRMETPGLLLCANRQPMRYYLQTDPRGAALYIIRPGDVPEGADVAGCYNRGICVY